VHLFGFGRESVNFTATAQQLFLIACLYSKNRQAAESYLGNDAKIEIWVENESTYPPSWCLIRQGESDWFFVCEGTTNAVQFTDHIGGVFFREDFAGETFANGSWVQQLEGMYLRISEKYGTIPDGIWRFSGHSYGGAIAQLMAYQMLDLYPSREVEIIGIAQPRAMSIGYSGPDPKAYWRVSSAIDLVPETPPPWSSVFQVRWRNPLNWVRSAYVWNHYGTEYILQWDGSISDELQFPPENLPPYVSSTFPEVHYLPNYAGRLLAWESANGPFPIMREALDGVISVTQGSAPLRIPWELPQVIPGPDGNPVLIPWVDPNEERGFGMSLYKVTYNFRGRSGANWNESHVLQSSSGIDAASDVAVGTALVDARLAMLDSAYTLHGCVATDLAGNRVSRKRTIGLAGTYNPVGNKADIAGVAVSLKWFGALAGNKFSWVRGIVDDSGYVNPETGETILNADWNTALGNWRYRLSLNGFGWVPRVPVQAGVPITQYNPIMAVNGALYPGFAQLTLMNPVLATAGQYITISQADRKTLPGMNGRFKLLQAAGATCVIEYQVANNATISNPGGRISVYQEGAFNAYSGVAWVKVIGRRTKDSFSPSRASRSARGIRTAR